MSQQPALSVEKLNAWYGRSHILQGVSFHVMPGEVVSLIGRNGAGKTTSMKSIMGLLGRTTGQVCFNGVSLLEKPAHERFHQGLAFVFEERRIVPGLTVMENIELGVMASPEGRKRTKEVVEEIAETFPRLKERLAQEAVTMSGGEQQMLAMGRGLMSRPKVLLLDEPSMGLSPIMVDKIFEVIREVAAQGVTILLVEQNASRALGIADRGYVMESGLITMSGEAKVMLSDPKVRAAYLGE